MKKIVAVAIVSILFSGCAAIPLDPQAHRIIASPNPAPNGCKYLGQIVGNQGNFFTGSYTSNPHLEEGSMNDMKNKANRLGANYIQTITNRASITGSIGRFSGRSEQTNVTNVGNAYKCPPASVGL